MKVAGRLGRGPVNSTINCPPGNRIAEIRGLEASACSLPQQASGRTVTRAGDANQICASRHWYVVRLAIRSAIQLIPGLKRSSSAKREENCSSRFFVSVSSRIHNKNDIVARSYPVLVGPEELSKDSLDPITFNRLAVFSYRTHRKAAVMKTVRAVDNAGTGAALPFPHSKDAVQF